MIPPAQPPERTASMSPTALLTATFQAQEWAVVLAAIDELPGKFGRVLHGRLTEQLQAQQRPSPPDAAVLQPNPDPANGQDHDGTRSQGAAA